MDDGAPGQHPRAHRAAELTVTARNAARLLAGARLTDVQAPGSLRGEAAAALRDARSRAGLPASWALGDRLTTVADVAVLEVRDGSEFVAVLKLARSPAADHDLGNHVDTVQDLAADPRLASSHPLLPEILVSGRAGASAYCVERAFRGTLGTAVPGRLDPAPAVRAIAELHRATGRASVATEELVDRWLQPGVDLVADVPMVLGSVRRRALLDRVRDRVRAGVVGRTVWLGRTHGDFVPGNVFTGPSGAVEGIIDWGQSRADDVALLDPVMFLVAARARAQHGALGRVVRDLSAGAPLTDREQAVLAVHRGRCPADPLPVDLLTLVAWLRHVANNLGKSPRYRAHPVWVHGTVEAVLKEAGRT